ncbi:DUF1702 family protein [Flagellimonas sp.]|uniref:DUF1702 family protein n=1 Tax=Flagellimonas sp. TaxID=2058762 RepID=UPI003F4A126C
MTLTDHLISYLFSVSSNEVKVDKRGFDCPNNKTATHLETVGESFLIGYHNGIVEKEEVYESLLPPLYSGFAYEGAAMGLVLRDLMGFNKFKRINKFLKSNQNHIYMIHVGIGWALARVPFTNILKQTDRFDSLLKELIIDGYGFHQAYFKTKKYVFERKFPTELGNRFLHPFHQGVGRAMWFVYGGQPDKISRHIDTFSKAFQGDLWAGVGLAMAYAGGVDEIIMDQLKLECEKYPLEIGQGVTFACKARLRANNMCDHTELAAQIFCGRTAQEAANLTDTSLVLVDRSGVSPYAQWRQEIMNKLKVKTYEKVV